MAGVDIEREWYLPVTHSNRPPEFHTPFSTEIVKTSIMDIHPRCLNVCTWIPAWGGKTWRLKYASYLCHEHGRFVNYGRVKS